eukprot:565772-Pleurochrysis_carterae.AAC.3
MRRSADRSGQAMTLMLVTTFVRSTTCARRALALLHAQLSSLGHVPQRCRALDEWFQGKNP